MQLIYYPTDLVGLSVERGVGSFQGRGFNQSLDLMSCVTECVLLVCADSIGYAMKNRNNQLKSDEEVF